MDPQLIPQQYAVRWNCLQLAAQYATNDSTIDNLLQDAQRLLLFMTPSTTEAPSPERH